MRMLSRLWALGLGLSLTHAEVSMSIGQCTTGSDQPAIDYKNNNPDPWDMHAFKATVAGNVLGADFPSAGSGTSIVLPGQSAADPYYFSCNNNVGSFYNKQLESKIGSCNEPDPPQAPQALKCLDGNTINTGGDYYNANKCIQDGLGVNRGDGYGGFIDSYRDDQTQIQVALPAGTWTVGGKTVRFDPTASMGGPFYMMSMIALQEYLYVDMQFMLALGASTSFAGLVDNTGKSLYASPLNVGNDQAPYGSFNMTYLTATGRIMADYPKYFPVKDLNKLVSTNGSGPTLGNSPQQLNSAFLGAMNLWWLFDGLKSAQDLCFRQFLKEAKDKAGGLKLMLGGWYIGPNAIGTATTPADDYATHVLPTTSQAILTDDDLTDKMKHFPYGQGDPDYDTPNYVTYVFTTLNKLVDANKVSTACGGAQQIYDAAITRQQVRELYFGQGGTAATQGNGGLLMHFNIPAGDRQKLWNDLDCAFDKLKGKNGRGAEEISYRYDFLTILRVARQYFGGFVNKFSDRPTPPSAYSSEYSIWVSNHSKTPCTRSVQDDVWPTMTLADSVYGKGAALTGTLTDNKGIKEYAYTTDTQWRKWTTTDKNFVIPANLPDNTRLWFRIVDSCGNATIQEIAIKTLPKLDPPQANPPGGNFYNTVDVTFTVPNATGATVYYTTDGSTPTTSSPQATPGTAVTINQGADFTLKAIAVKSGYTQSDPAQWSFTHQNMPVTKTPTANPPGKTFSTLDPDFTVALSDAESGAVIHYTTDGSTPDSTSPVYSAPIAVTTTMTIKAIATKAGQLASPVMSETYTETTAPQVEKPVATPPGVAGTTPYNFFTSPLGVALSDATPGATIWYSLDGGALTSGTSVSLTQSATLKVVAKKPGLYDSDTLTIRFNFTPPVTALSGVLRDDDGDGQIDRAVVTFDKALPVLPDSLSFTVVDQAGALGTAKAKGAALAFDGVNTRVTVKLDPMPFGITSVGAGSKGHTFAQNAVPLDDHDFSLTDEVPPVITHADVFEADSAHALKRVVLSLSEVPSAPLASQTAFIFKRNGAVLGSADIKVVDIKVTGNREVTLEIDSLSPKSPIRGDSVAINTLGEVKDAAGNAPKTPHFQILEGPIVPAKPTTVMVYFYNEKLDAPDAAGPEPTAADNGVLFIPIDQNGATLSGNTDGKCGGCFVGGTGAFVGPIFVMEIPSPVEYDFQIYDKLGNFVAKGGGKITEPDMASLKPGRGGKTRLARVVWTGRTAKGAKAATGVYILQTTLRFGLDEKTGALPTSQVDRTKFGLLRHFGGS